MKIAVLACALTVALAPSRAETKLERGKRVIDEAVAALGGDRFLQMEDRIETGRADVVETQPVEIIDVTDGDNRVVTVYFNQITKLPARQVTNRRDPKTNLRVEEVTRFSKYREVDGVMWPYDIQRERDGEKIYQMYSDSVAINRDLKDDLFTLPANMKILKKEK